jgi:hypothetical protein
VDVDTDGTGLLVKNIPMIILFSSLILADFFWGMANQCITNPILPVIAAGIGAIFGIIWASVLTTNKLTDFYYISGTSTKEICSAPTQKRFKCSKPGSTKVDSKSSTAKATDKPNTHSDSSSQSLSNPFGKSDLISNPFG